MPDCPKCGREIKRFADGEKIKQLGDEHEYGKLDNVCRLEGNGMVEYAVHDVESDQS